jgi:hypothetical protein
MPNINFIVNVLGKHVVSKSIAHEDMPDLNGILFYKKSVPVSGSFIYISSASSLKSLMESDGSDERLTIFVPAQTEKTFIESSVKHNIIQTDLEITSLYNRLTTLVHNYNHWRTLLLQAMFDGKSLSGVLSIASDLIRAPIFLLNPYDRVIYGSERTYFSDDCIDALTSEGHLPQNDAGKFKASCISIYKKDFYEVYHSQKLNHYYHFLKIHENGATIAKLLIVTNPSHRNVDVSYMLYKLSQIVVKFLNDLNIDNPENDILFSSFISDIIESRLTDSREIEERSKYLRFPLMTFMAVIVVRHADNHEFANTHLIDELMEIFEGDNITLHNNDIVILHTQEARNFEKLDFDYDKLEELMTRYNVYAGISNSTRNPDMLRTLYLISSDTIRLATTLHRRSLSDRVFIHEDYSFYYLIDLAARKFVEEHHHENIIYLIHPAIVALYRYDTNHDSNLMDVLFYYILNERSISLTGKALYMHRNTVLNKIKKITEIIQIPIEDGHTDFRILSSCLIVRYYQKYMNQIITI